jgi:hypothetical protein
MLNRGDGASEFDDLNVVLVEIWGDATDRLFPRKPGF